MFQNCSSSEPLTGAVSCVSFYIYCVLIVLHHYALVYMTLDPVTVKR